MNIKKFFKISILLLALFTLFSCKKAEKVEAPKEYYTIPLGEYQDSLSERATMTVSFRNKVYCFEINWANSAFENTKWVFSGVYNESIGGVAYNNEICLDQIFEDNGDVTETETYTGGNGIMRYENGKLYWIDEQEEKHYDKEYNCIFEKVNYED